MELSPVEPRPGGAQSWWSSALVGRPGGPQRSGRPHNRGIPLTPLGMVGFVTTSHIAFGPVGKASPGLVPPPPPIDGIKSYSLVG